MFSASRRSDNPEKKKKAVIQEANLIIIWPIMYSKRLTAATMFYKPPEKAVPTTTTPLE